MGRTTPTVTSRDESDDRGPKHRVQPMTPAPPAWHADRLVAAGVELARFTAGSSAPAAPVILLLHGLGHWTSAAWDRLLPEIDPSWRTVAIDLPGFGASAKPDVRYDPAFFGRVLAGLAELLPPRFAVCGHSLGGVIAADYAAAHPERVSHLALIAPPGFAASSRLVARVVAAQLLQYAGRRSPPPWLVTRTLLGAVHDPVSVDAAVVARGLALARDPQVRRSFARVYAHALPTALDLRRARRSWPRFRGPVLTAWGRHDRFVPLVPPQTIARIYPQAVQLVLERSAHLPMVEEPAAFGAALRRLLTSPPS